MENIQKCKLIFIYFASSLTVFIFFPINLINKCFFFTGIFQACSYPLVVFCITEMDFFVLDNILHNMIEIM